jgi:hypothetical protein
MEPTQTANPVIGRPITILAPPLKPSWSGCHGSPDVGTTYYENPFKNAMRSEAAVSQPRDLQEILLQQKGYDDLHLSAPLPPSSVRAISDLGQDQINARIERMPEDFARMAVGPKGIVRLRVLALVAVDAYQPAGHKYLPKGREEAAIYEQARETWEKMCRSSRIR